ncbi:MAG: hypothetical protein EH225_09235 [Calditrichaeota bacterium]|nr:hypothetical protein [Calditrichota bacterium]RQW01784.1 MAG: hypothetical protein EH225_09235 [Calditrichota bacterium]
MKKNFLIFLAFLIMALMLNFTNHFILFPLALGGMLLLNIQVYRLFFRWKFLVFLAFLIFAVPLFAGDKNAVFLGISYSSDLFRSSVVMAERSVILLMGLKFLTSRISVEQMAQAMANSRFKRFSQVFSLSMQALPDVRSITNETLREFRHESTGRNFLSNLSDYAIKFMVRILHYAGSFYDQKPLKDITNE